jgi:hypothetical protein
MVEVLSAPPVTVFPAASSIVAVNVRVAPAASSAVEPAKAIWAAVPYSSIARATTLTVP